MLREAGSYPVILGKLLRWRRTSGAQADMPPKISYGPDPAQYFLDFAPDPAAPPRDTMILYLHGGGWNKGSPAFFSFIGQRFAREGYRCIMPGYRLAPRFRFPSQIEDVRSGTKAALSYLSYLSCLEEREKPTGHIVVVGSSAGGQLGALLCYDGELAGQFAGFIGLGGPYRFDLEPTPFMRRLCAGMLGKGDPQAAQPRYLLKEDSPKTPMLIVQGLGDAIVNYACGADFYRRAVQLGIPARFYMPEKGRDSHSAYVAGCFLEKRERRGTLNALLSWLEELEESGVEPSGPENV